MTPRNGNSVRSSVDHDLLIELKTTLSHVVGQLTKLELMLNSIDSKKADIAVVRALEERMDSEFAGILNSSAESMGGMSKGAREVTDILARRLDAVEAASEKFNTRWWMIVGAFALLEFELGIIAIVKGWF